MEIIELIYHSFIDCSLDDEFTLLEWSFFDTHYRYTTEIDNQYLENYGSSPDKILIDLKKDYPDNYSDILIKSVNCRDRTIENRSNWEQITFDYLYNFSSDVCYLSPKAFKFYLPAAMTIYADCVQKNEDTSYFLYFYSRLERLNAKDLALFDKEQLHAIADFLVFYQKNQISVQEINDIIYLIKNIVQLTNQYYLVGEI